MTSGYASRRHRAQSSRNEFNSTTDAPQRPVQSPITFA